LVGVLLVLASMGAVTDGSVGDADSVAIETEPGTQQTAGEQITVEDGSSGPSAKVTDQSGNPVDATVEVEAIDGPGSLTGASTTTGQTGDDGITTFNDLEFNETGDYRLNFTIDSAAVNIAESASAESQTFTVTPGDVDRVELDRTDTQAITAGETLEFSATAFNESDDLVEDDDSAFSWAEAADDGTFTTTTAGEYDVTATYGVETSSATAVIVESADPDTLSVSNVSGTANEDSEIDALLEDEYGNTVSDEDVTVTSNDSLGWAPRR